MKKLLVLLLLLSLLSAVSCGENTQNQSDVSLGLESSGGTPESTEDSFENESSEVIVDNFKAGYIDFESDCYGTHFYNEPESYDAYDSYRFPQRFSDGKAIVFFDEYKDFSEYCAETEFSPAENFTEDYFKENAVIFGFFGDGSSTPEFAIKNIYADESRNVTVTVRYLTHGGGDQGIQNISLVAKVKKSDLNKVASIKCVCESVSGLDYFYCSENNEGAEELVFKAHDFSGKISNINRQNLSNNPITVEWMEVAKDSEELRQITQRYSNSADDTDFTDYATTLGDDFFENNILILTSYSCIYNNSFVEIDNVISYENGLVIDVEINSTAATVFEDSNRVIAVEVPKQEWSENIGYTMRYKHYVYKYNGELNKVDYTPYVLKLEVEPQGGSNAALDDLPGNLTTYAAHNKEGLNRVFENALFFNDLSEEPIASFLEQFDDEFFKDNALLIGRHFFLDKGEDVKITEVKRVKQPYISNIAMHMTVEIDDRVQPSSNENMECYICVAAIEKNEMVGMETSGKLTIK